MQDQKVAPPDQAQPKQNWARRRIDGAQKRFESDSTRARRAFPSLDLLWEIFWRFRNRNGSVLVGHLAYRSFLWLAPLMLVLSAGLGFSTSTFDLIEYAQQFDVSTSAATSALEQAEQSRMTTLVIGLPALAIASWSLIRGIHYAYSQAWAVPIASRKNTVRQSMMTVLGAVAVAVVIVAISAVQRQGPLLALAGWAGTWLMALAALWLLQLTMPHAKARARDLLPGPLFGAVGLSLVQLFATVYLPQKMASSSALYGAFGMVFAVLFYVFLVAYLLVLAPFVNTVWVDREEILDGRPWVVDPDAAPRILQKPLNRILGRHSANDDSEKSD
jgi:membrane protein